MSDLTVFFSGSVLSSSWIQVFFILIEDVFETELNSSFLEEICLGLGEFYGL